LFSSLQKTAGFYCPSEPNNPSTSSMEVPCGSVDRYCPANSSAPSGVDIGYYSIGGEGYGETAELYRIRQEICPKGSYCDNGRKHNCPAGTYGDQTGLFYQFCSGFCPAGFYCVEGTSEPVECPNNTYAISGSTFCVSCNTPQKEGQLRCKTGRNCCSHY